MPMAKKSGVEVILLLLLGRSEVALISNKQAKMEIAKLNDSNSAEFPRHDPQDRLICLNVTNLHPVQRV